MLEVEEGGEEVCGGGKMEELGEGRIYEGIDWKWRKKRLVEGARWRVRGNEGRRR